MFFCVCACLHAPVCLCACVLVCLCDSAPGSLPLRIRACVASCLACVSACPPVYPKVGQRRHVRQYHAASAPFGKHQGKRSISTVPPLPASFAPLSPSALFALLCVCPYTFRHVRGFLQPLAFLPRRSLPLPRYLSASSQYLPCAASESTPVRRNAHSCASSVPNMHSVASLI